MIVVPANAGIQAGRGGTRSSVPLDAAVETARYNNAKPAYECVDFLADRRRPWAKPTAQHDEAG